MTLDQYNQAIQQSGNDFLSKAVFERMRRESASDSELSPTTLSCKEYVFSMYLLRHGSEEDRMKFTFAMFDLDNSGSIEKADLVGWLRVRRRCI